MSEKEIKEETQKEIESAKEKVAKGDFTNTNWEYLLPMLLMLFMPFGKEDNKTCGAKEEPKTENSDQHILKNFVDTAQQKLKDMLEKFDEDEFQKYLIHAIATEIEEIKKKQASAENCIAALQSTVQYIMFSQRPYMPSYMPFYIPTPPYDCTQNTETQSQDLANKSEKES